MKKAKQVTSDEGRVPSGQTVANPGRSVGATKEELLEVPYELVQPDPNQPRKSFPEESLRELADSIAANGLAQRPVVQRVPARYRIEEPNLMHDDWVVVALNEAGKLPNEQTRDVSVPADGSSACVFRGPNENMCRAWAGKINLVESYRIIFGERRWRAMGLLGWAKLPVIVREITEGDRFKLQFVENAQRENVTALEEAEALRVQLDQRRAANPEFKAEDLGAELGMSRAAVYNRLVLLRLSEPVRAALLAGKLTTSHARVLAQVPTPALQARVIEECGDTEGGFSGMSVRELQEAISDDYAIQLDGAPFSRTWKCGSLPTCKECPKRTGNLVAEFPELASRPNVCTDEGCYETKATAHYMADGRDKHPRAEVYSATAFAPLQKLHVAAEDYIHAGGEYKSWMQHLGKNEPPVVVEAHRDGLRYWYNKDAAKAALAKLGLKLRETSTKKQTPAEAQAEAAEKKRVEALRKERDELKETLAPELARGYEKLKDAAALLLLEKYTEKSYYSDLTRNILKLVKSPRGRAVVQILDDQHRSVTEWETGEWDKEALAFYQALGVDLVAIEQARKGETPELKAAVEQDPEGYLFPNKGKLKTIKLDANSKARIAAAARARWAKIKAAK